MRAVFDSISLSVLSFLESHESVTDVVLQERPGVNVGQLQRWDRVHDPLVLPADLRNFVAVCDGVHLTWSVRLANKVSPLGAMRVNRLEDIVALPVTQRNPHDPDSLYLSDDDFSSSDEAEAEAEGRDRFEALALDSSPQGDVVLLYRIPAGASPAETRLVEPEVWLQDLAQGWHRIASSFTDYFRLMVMHLGLPGWQYAFTPFGLAPATQQWLQFFSPERSQLDADALAARRQAAASVGSAPATAKPPRRPSGAPGSQLDLAALQVAPPAAASSSSSSSSSSAAAPSHRRTGTSKTLSGGSGSGSSASERPGSAPPRSPQR